MKNVVHICSRVLLWLMVSLVSIVLLVVLALQFQFVQQYIVQSATSYVSGKTHTRVEVNKIDIGFPKNIVIEGVFAEDLTHDTLVNIRELSIGANLWELCKGNIVVSSLELNGATVKLNRGLPDSTFNFNFLIEAFAGDKTGDEVQKESSDTGGLIPIRVDMVTLNDVRLNYHDEVVGINLMSDIGRLNVEMETTDLDKMIFESNQIHLAHSRVNFLIEKTSPEDTDTTSSGALPEIGAKKIVLEDIGFVFNHQPDSFKLNTQIGLLEVKPNKVDLNNTVVDVEQVVLLNSHIAIQTVRYPSSEKRSESDTQGTANTWKVQVTNVVMKDNGFNFDVNNLKRLPKGIDYNHLGVSNLKLVAHHLYYSNDLIKGDVKQIQLNEQCGFVLQRLRTQFVFDDKHIELANLRLQTPHTRITDYVSIAYPSLKSIGERADELLLMVNFNKTKVAMGDVLLFAPDLLKEEIIRQNKSGIIAINGQISGSLANIKLADMVIQPAQHTVVAFDGTIQGLPETQKLKYDVSLHSLLATESDIQQLLPVSFIPSSISIPTQIKAKGKISGTVSANQSELNIETTSGDVNVVSGISGLNQKPIYSIEVETEELQVGKITRNKIVGAVTGNIVVTGESFDLTNMHTKINAAFSSAEFNRYAYSNIDLTAGIDSGVYAVKLGVNDQNLELNVLADVLLRGGNKELKLNTSLSKARLKELHFTKDNIQVQGNINSHITQKDSANLKGNLSVANVVIQKNAKPYKLDSLAVVTLNARKNHSLKVDHSIVKIDYKGETNFDEIGSVVSEYVAVLLNADSEIKDTGVQGFTCRVEVLPHPVITEVLMPEIKVFEGLVLDASYKNVPQQTMVNLSVPAIDYNGNRMDGVRVKINGRDNTLEYELFCMRFKSGSVEIPKTTINGSINNQIVDYTVKVFEPDSGYKLLFAGDINLQQKNRTAIHLNEKAVLGGSDWQIKKSNEIILTSEGMKIVGLELNNADNNFIKVNSLKDRPNSPVNIDFGNFQLGALSSIIEKDTAIVRGVVDGNIILQSFSPFAFTSDLKVTDMLFQNSSVGDLIVKASNEGDDSYSVQLGLSGDDNAVFAKGNLKGETIDVGIHITQLNMHTIETFVPDFIKRGKGYMAGDLHLSGKLTAPAIDGEMVFKEAGFYLTAINNRLYMRNEKVRINPGGVSFNNFTVLDSTGQPLIVNGDVQMTNFKNFKFNIDITTENFRVLNTTSEQNEMYYGTILLSSVIKVRGTDVLPDVKADVHLQKGSSFTFVVQESEVSADRGDGVVVFVDSIQLANDVHDTLSIKASISGIEFNANLEIDPQANFKIITDKISGDFLEVNGGGTLNFSIDASSKMSLVGTYILDGGKYKASFQKVVKKEFDIKKGSTITWTGDPLNAEMDLTAIYTTRTSPADLFPEGLQSGNSKILPFEVNLVVGGQLLNPKLSFLLDMPPRERANNANVYNRISDINNNPDELNKQVFALLVLEGFLPAEQSSSPNAGEAVSTIARNSVNQLLSDQMNRFSGKYIKGAELNFNIVSDDKYTMAGTEQNTELQIGLKKELFNSKLSVQVGGNIDLNGANNQQTSNQNITGDVVAEYKLSKDGSYRAKAFMENQYEGIIDGNLYKSGLGLMYVKDYNKFSDLFNHPKDTLQPKTK